MAVIDIIVIAILVVFGIVGMVKGFLNTLISLFSTLASVGVAIFAARPVAKLLDKIFGIVTGIGSRIAGSIADTIKPFQDGFATTELTGEALKDYLAKDGLTFPERVFRLLIEDSKIFSASGDMAAADQTVVQYIGERAAAVIAVIIAAVVVFLLLKLGVFLLAKLFDALTKNRAISGLDRAMGLIVGLVKASFIICVTLGIFYLIANSTVQGWIDNSVVTRWIYQYVRQFVEYIATKYDLPSFITGLFPALS